MNENEIPTLIVQVFKSTEENQTRLHSFSKINQSKQHLLADKMSPEVENTTRILRNFVC